MRSAKSQPGEGAEGNAEAFVIPHAPLTALASSEQCGLGGFAWLLAFDNDKIQEDAGAVLRAEASFPRVFRLADPLGGAFAPYLFSAAGLAKREQPTTVKEATTRATSFGVGARFALPEKASPHSATLTLEYAHGTATDMDSANRLNMRFIARF